MNKTILSTILLVSQLVVAPSQAEPKLLDYSNTVAAAVLGGVATNALQTELLSPRFPKVVTIEDVVTNARTPSSGILIIHQEATPENVRAFLMDREIDKKVALQLDAETVRGSWSPQHQIPGPDAARIAEIDARIAELKSMNDFRIMMRANGKQPVVNLEYVDRAELAQHLRNAPGNGPLNIEVHPSAARTAVRSIIGGAVVGALTFTIIKAMNPASAAETQSDRSIPFADTQTAE